MLIKLITRSLRLRTFYKPRSSFNLFMLTLWQMALRFDQLPSPLENIQRIKRHAVGALQLKMQTVQLRNVAF